MKILDKYGIFKECGFNTALGDMPNLRFHGYDEALQMCYKAGRDAAYIEAFVDNSEIPELRKKIKDLETANARLFERNHELQVDNEESLKEVEEYSKRCDELRRGIAEHAKAYTIQKDTIEMCKQEIDYLHGCLGDRDRALLNLQNSVVGTLENAPKSKFVITVEEF